MADNRSSLDNQDRNRQDMRENLSEERREQQTSTRESGNRSEAERNERSDEQGRTQSRKSSRGFASMDPQKQREIASEGGRAAHRQGVAHKWTSDEAREAGRKGGRASQSRRSPEQ